MKAGVRPDITGKLILRDGTKIDLVPSDFRANSINIRTGTSNRGEFTVGAAVIGALDLDFMNDTGRFSGIDWVNAQIYLAFEVEDESVFTDLYFVANHEERGRIVSCECYDALKIMDEHQLYELNMTWPADAVDVVTAMVNKCFKNATITGLDGKRGLMIPDPGDDRMTFRTCMSHIAQLFCRFVQYKLGGKIDFGWYDMTTSYDAGTTFSHDLRTNNVLINGVSVTANDDSTVERRGAITDSDVDYQLEISGNPFITPENCGTIADNIYAGVNGISFCPGNISILGNPAIEAGDLLQFDTGDRENVKMLATNLSYNPGGLRQSVTGDFEPYQGDLRIKRAEYVRRVIKQELNNPNSDLSKAVNGGRGGKGGRTPEQAYADTRPDDWLTMPEPVDGECYMLCLIPDGGSSIVALEINTAGSDGYDIQLGDMEPEHMNSSRCILELDSSDFGNVTSDGFAQCMLKITGDITKIAPASDTDVDYKNWCIVEICARLSNVTSISCCVSSSSGSWERLQNLQYFTLRGENNITSDFAGTSQFMLAYLPSIICVRELDMSKVTRVQNGYRDCPSLIAVPPMNLDSIGTAALTNLFYNDFSLERVGAITGLTNNNCMMMFYGCHSLMSIPDIDFSKVNNYNSMFMSCRSIRDVNIEGLTAEGSSTILQNMFNQSGLRSAEVNTAATSTGMFTGANTLMSLRLHGLKTWTANGVSTLRGLQMLELDPFVNEFVSYETMAGNATGINIQKANMTRKNLLRLFHSLPTVYGYTLYCSGTPGYSKLTNDDKAIATGKGWELM